MAVWIALVAAALGVPRPVAQTELPEPLPDRRALSWREADERGFAEEARRWPLPYDVRAVGELFRRHGAASAAGEGERAARLLSDLRDASRVALARHGERALLRLRAVQGELFEQALEAFERSGQSSRELEELGGNLIAKAKENGWLEGKRLLMSRDARRVFFRIRWSDLTGTRRVAAFAPRLDEWRVYYGFLLTHPEGKTPSDKLRSRLAYVNALAKRDAEYPAWLARGVVQYELGALPEAVEAFRTQLEERPDGPYVLRAKNYLLGALAKAERAE